MEFVRLVAWFFSFMGNLFTAPGWLSCGQMPAKADWSAGLISGC